MLLPGNDARYSPVVARGIHANEFEVIDAYPGTTTVYIIVELFLYSGVCGVLFSVFVVRGITRCVLGVYGVGHNLHVSMHTPVLRCRSL